MKTVLGGISGSCPSGQAELHRLGAPRSDPGRSDFTIAEYLDRAISTFAGDPPDSDFQRGYLKALETVRAEGGIEQSQHLFDAATALTAAIESRFGFHRELQAMRAALGEQVSA